MGPIKRLARWILREEMMREARRYSSLMHICHYWKREADKVLDRYEQLSSAHYGRGAKRLLEEREDARVGYRGSDV